MLNVIYCKYTWGTFDRPEWEWRTFDRWSVNISLIPIEMLLTKMAHINIFDNSLSEGQAARSFNVKRCTLKGRIKMILKKYSKEEYLRKYFENSDSGNGLAGEGWLRRFMRRDTTLSLWKSRSTNLSKSTDFNKNWVNFFLQIYTRLVVQGLCKP